MLNMTKDNKIALLILLFTPLALFNIGIGVFEYTNDSSEVDTTPELSVEPVTSNHVNADPSLIITSDSTLQPITQVASSRATQVSDSSQKLSGLQVLPSYGPINITSNADFASYPNKTGICDKLVRIYVVDNNTATSNSQYGFRLDSSSNNMLNENVATSNSLHGFFLNPASSPLRVSPFHLCFEGGI